MLQPSQLTDVSIRYADEIVELRDFLVKAGCTVRTGQALGQVADRLSQDRAFHRDLTSHVWVLMDRYDGISYSDLLGVLAIAAAGSGIASTADEADAHRLLRFLMEARHSLDAVSGKGRTPVRETAEAVAAPLGEPLLPVRGGRHEVAAEPLRASETDLFSGEKLHDSGRQRRGVGWVVAAVCILAAVLVGAWLKLRPTGNAGSLPVTASPAAPAATPAGTQAAGGSVASSSAPAESVPPPVADPEHRVARASGHSGIVRKNARGVASNAARSSREAEVAAPYLSTPAANVPPPVTTTATRGPAPALPAPVASTPPPTVQAPSAHPANALNTPAAPVVRSAGVAHPALGGPPVPPKKGLSAVPSFARPDAQQSDDEISRSNTPVLRRRHPDASSATAAEDGTTNVAAGGAPPAVPAAGGGGNVGVSGGGGAGAETGGGTVHGTSLGIMAANLMYSPMPAYPAAAAASHVQGEVKLSADVDRDGKVASVRVISGPPLLRDAAMDAVGHWRYRPYRSSGGPVPMAAIEVLDFELP